MRCFFRNCYLCTDEIIAPYSAVLSFGCGPYPHSPDSQVVLEKIRTFISRRDPCIYPATAS